MTRQSKQNVIRVNREQHIFLLSRSLLRELHELLKLRELRVLRQLRQRLKLCPALLHRFPLLDVVRTDQFQQNVEDLQTDNVLNTGRF